MPLGRKIILSEFVIEHVGRDGMVVADLSYSYTGHVLIKYLKDFPGRELVFFMGMAFIPAT